MEDAVRIDIEGNLNLRHAARSGVDAVEVELAEGLVVHRLLALALQNVNGYRSLVVLGGREDLGLLGRDGGVLGDKSGHDAAQGLDSEGKRGDIKKENVVLGS